MTIHIDPEFQKLIPPLTTDEYAQLESNIIAEGIRDPLVLWERGECDFVVIDGHHRKQIAERHGLQYKTITKRFDSRDAVMDWMDKNQLGRRNLTEAQTRLIRGRTYERRKKTHGGDRKSKGNFCPLIEPTAESVSKEFGVSARTIKNDAAFARECDADPELNDLVMDGGDVKKYKKEKKKQAAKESLEKSIKEIVGKAKDLNFDDVCNIRHCDFAALLKNTTPDCIITDPPYEKKYLPLYELFAKSAKGVPLVAVMCGQTYLPDVYAMLSKHLKYRWTLAYLTPGGQAVQQFSAKVNTFWKPVLLFGDALDWIGDVCKSDINDNDKRFHEWGQSESGMGSLIERLSKPGQLVCDPFCGAGTTGVAALALGRCFVGCDIDADAVNSAKARCYEVLQNA